MAKRRAEVFRAIEEFGGQYRTKQGGIVTIPQDVVTIDADVDSMYAVKGDKMLLKFGWEEVFENLPKALSADELKAQELIDAGKKNVAYKAKADEADQ